MMEVEYTSHGPEGDIMKKPSNIKPSAGMQHSLIQRYKTIWISLKQRNNIVDKNWENFNGYVRTELLRSWHNSSSIADSGDYQKDEEDGHQNQIAPPNNRIAQQVNFGAFNTGREKLTLQMIRFWLPQFLETLSMLITITLRLMGHIQGLEVISPSLGFKPALPLNMTRCDSTKRWKKFSLYSVKLILGTVPTTTTNKQQSESNNIKYWMG